MKKLSIFALLSVLSVSAFAAEEKSADIVSVSKDDAVAVAAMEEKAVLAESTLTPVSEEFTPTTENVSEEYIKSDDEKYSFLKGLQIGIGASATGGLNGFIGYANKDFDSFWAKRFGVRLDFATTCPVKSLISNTLDSVLGNDGIDIGEGLTINDINLSAKHYAAMLDFYPLGNTWLFGGWRLTGGYYIGDMHASAGIAGVIEDLSGGAYEFELMGNQFRYLGNSVHGSAQFDWDYHGPYLGTGFDLGLFAGFKIYLDAGVVFTNRAAQLDLDIPFTGLEIKQNGIWENVEDNNLQSVVDGIVSETLSDAQSELNDLKFYPIVKLGFMYRF